MPLKAIAWDVDGTLVDSEPLHLRSLVAICGQFGVDVSDLADDAFIGVHVHEVWAALAARFAGRVARAQWLDALNGYYRRHAHEVAPMPGGVETVARFAAAGLVQAAVSNSNRVVVDANLRAAGLARYMAATVSLDDVAAGKPDPAPYLAAAQALGIAAADMLAVEDSATGLHSARAAGLVTVGFGNDTAALAGADHVIGDLRCLAAIVERR